MAHGPPSACLKLAAPAPKSILCSVLLSSATSSGNAPPELVQVRDNVYRLKLANGRFYSSKDDPVGQWALAPKGTESCPQGTVPPTRDECLAAGSAAVERHFGAAAVNSNRLYIGKHAHFAHGCSVQTARPDGSRTWPEATDSTWNRRVIWNELSGTYSANYQRVCSSGLSGRYLSAGRATPDVRSGTSSYAMVHAPVSGLSFFDWTAG